MKEISGNIWDFHSKGNWIVITTNEVIKKDGSCAMGRGIALQAKNRFPNLPYELGERIKKHGNICFAFTKYRIITFPVKYGWKEKASYDLIDESCEKLVSIFQRMNRAFIYLVRPGCGNGGLGWEDVKPVLDKWLNDRYVVVERDKGN